MGNESSKRIGWLLSPFLFTLFIAMLAVTWAVLPPETLMHYFDRDGYSAFELATLPFYALIVPAVWIARPFEGSRKRQIVLSAMVTIVALMAIVKETDFHNTVLHALYPAFTQADGTLAPGLVKPDGSPLSGTPFKMRVLTNPGVPAGMKAAIAIYFAAFFGVFAAGFLFLLPSWLKGVFSLRPDAWSVGCFGASGVLVQISDRLPSWVKHATGEKMAAADGTASAARSLCTALEEGGEMMIAVFALIAIFQAGRTKK